MAPAIARGGGPARARGSHTVLRHRMLSYLWSRPIPARSSGPIRSKDPIPDTPGDPDKPVVHERQPEYPVARPWAEPPDAFVRQGLPAWRILHQHMVFRDQIAWIYSFVAVVEGTAGKCRFRKSFDDSLPGVADDERPERSLGYLRLPALVQYVESPEPGGRQDTEQSENNSQSAVHPYKVGMRAAVIKPPYPRTQAS